MSQIFNLKDFMKSLNYIGEWSEYNKNCANFKLTLLLVYRNTNVRDSYTSLTEEILTLKKAHVRAFMRENDE